MRSGRRTNRPWPATMPGADHFVSGSLDRRFAGVESRRHTVHLLNEPSLAKLLQLPGLPPKARGDFVRIGTNLCNRVFHNAGCPVTQLDALQLDLGVRLFPRLGC